MELAELTNLLRTHDDERLYQEADELMARAADAIESLQEKVAELEFECDTFRHGHRIASDNCVRLEAKLAELEGNPIIKPDGSALGTGSP